MRKPVLFTSAFNSVAKSSVVKSFKGAIQTGVYVAICYGVAWLFVSAIEKCISTVKNMKPENDLLEEIGRFDAEITNALFDKYYDDDLKDNQLYTINHFCEILNSCGYAHVACTLWTADDARYDVIFQNGEIHVVNVKNDETVFRTSYTCVAWERTVIDREIVDRGG